MPSLEQINSNLPLEDNLRAIRDNFITISKTQNKIGANLIVNGQTQAQIAVGTSEVTLSAAEFKANGGLIVVSYQATVTVGSNGMLIRVYIDDVLKFTSKTAETGGSVIEVPHNLIWATDLDEGTHIIRVKAVMGGGTGYVGGTDSNSVLQLVEILRG